MSWLRRLLERWTGRADEDLDREVQAHLDLEAEEREQGGLPAREARNAARRAFGSAALAKEDVREEWGWTRVEQAAQDVRYALRGLRRNPGLAAAAIVSLALGTGATTAVFSVLNAVALRPLPVESPERLVILQAQLRGKRFVLFHPQFEELRGAQKRLAGMVAISDEPYMKAAFGKAAPVFVRGSRVSGEYFELLGVAPAFGRLLTASDDDPAVGTCAVVISHAYWTSAMRGDRDVLGRPVVLGEKLCAIVGVAPAGFRSHEPGYAPDLWAPLRPLTAPRLLASRSMAFYSGVMGRLAEGSTIGEAEAELNGLYRRMQAPSQRSPRPGEPATTPADFAMRLLPGEQGLDLVRGRLETPLGLALAVTGVVLLIAAVNVANLLLARGTARTAELATRAALGAGRVRLMRLLAVEGALLCAGGGLLGAALAAVATPALAGVLPVPSTVTLDAAPDIRVWAAAAGATLLAALLAAILPAWKLSRQNVQSGIACAGRSTASGSGQRLTRGLVAAQLALSLLLVTVAGLLLRTMLHVMHVDPGFDTTQVVLMSIQDTEPAARFGETETQEQKTRRAVLYQALDQRLNAIAGVRSASVSWLGLFGSSYVGLNLYEAGRPEQSGRFTLVDYVSPRYFETVGMQLLRGRMFTESDGFGAAPVAVVNEAFVRERIGGGREAIGARFVMTYGEDRREWTIGGVLRDAKYQDLREARTEPMMWVPIAQAPFKATSVSLRVRAGTEAAVTREARAALAASSPHLMVRNVTTLRAQVDRGTARERLLLGLSSGFGTIALLLAAVGLYGTLAYAVARRTREIGVRLALGARPGTVRRLVLAESLKLAAVGLAAGIPLSIGAGRLMRSFLFGVTEYDAPSYVAAGLVLALTALLAAYGPARRASRVDPMSALRSE